jgi:hypothetical protein
MVVTDLFDTLLERLERFILRVVCGRQLPKDSEFLDSSVLYVTLFIIELAGDHV